MVIYCAQLICALTEAQLQRQKVTACGVCVKRDK